MAECEWVILCDYAFPAEHGKLCLIGIFDKIWTAQTPITHERAAIAFSMLGEPGEKVVMKLTIIRPGGTLLQKFELEFVLPDSGSARGSVDVRGLILPDFGPYAIEIDLGREEKKTTFLSVQQPASGPRSGRP